MGDRSVGCVLPPGPTLSLDPQDIPHGFHRTLVSVFCLVTPEACIMSLSPLLLLKRPFEATSPSLLCARGTRVPSFLCVPRGPLRLFPFSVLPKDWGSFPSLCSPRTTRVPSFLCAPRGPGFFPFYVLPGVGTAGKPAPVLESSPGDC